MLCSGEKQPRRNQVTLSHNPRWQFEPFALHLECCTVGEATCFIERYRPRKCSCYTGGGYRYDTLNMCLPEASCLLAIFEKPTLQTCVSLGLCDAEMLKLLIH